MLPPQVFLPIHPWATTRFARRRDVDRQTSVKCSRKTASVVVRTRRPETHVTPARLPAMSQRNLEVIRRGFEALSSGEIERIVDFVDPHFEGQVPPELSTEPDTYRGHAGIRRYFQSFWDDMEDIRFEAERMWE